MSALSRSASMLLREPRLVLGTRLSLRPARESDLPALARLVAPRVAEGSILPRVLVAADFLVAEGGGRLLGCVALTEWTSEVVELGTLVSDAPGRGLGSLLVEAASAEARRRGYRTIVALTGITGFFQRCGFEVQADRPWARARGLWALPAMHGASRSEAPGLEELAPAVEAKARKCAACARLGACRQDLLALRLAPAIEVAA